MGNVEKIQSLKGRVASDPYDNIAWEQVLGEISRGRKSEEQAGQLREVYEDLLSKFPTAVSLNTKLRIYYKILNIQRNFIMQFMDSMINDSQFIIS